MKKLNNEQRKLIEDNYSLIWHLYNEAYCARLDKDEYVGMAHIALCKAALKYNSSKGKFSTYFVWQLKAEISHYFSCKHLDVRKANNNIISFEMPIRTNGEPLTFEDALSGNKNIWNDIVEYIYWNQKINDFSEKNKRIILLAYFGYKQKEIAKMLGIRQQRVSDALRTIKRAIGY